MSEHFYWDYVNHLHQAYTDIENEGILIDEEKRLELYDKYRAKEEAGDKELESLAGRYVNVNSSLGDRSISTLLYRDLGLPKREGAGEEILVSLLGNVVKDSTHKRIIELILELRRIKKTIGTYILALPDYDRRMRTNYRIVGTETGRTSTSLLGPPVRPDIVIERRGKRVKKKIGSAFQTWTKHGEVGPDIRSMYIPDEGYVFGEADLAQAESRIVALLTEEYELLGLMDTPGYDVHKKFSSAILGIDERLIDSNMRFIGKEVGHAFVYGIQKHTCMLTINTDARKFGIPLTLGEKEVQRLLTTAHNVRPAVRAVFHAGIVDCLKNNKRTLVNPFGRIRQFFERWGEDLFREAYNGIPQSTVRDQVGHAILEIRRVKPSIRIFGEAHDAIYWQSKEEEFNEDAGIVREAFERPIDFSKCSLRRDTLRIPCEIKIGKHDLKNMEKTS